MINAKKFRECSALSANKNSILTACEDKTAKLGDTKIGECLQALQYGERVKSTCFSLDGNHILTTCFGGEVTL